MLNTGIQKIKWYKSLSVLGLLGLTVVPLLDLVFIFGIMNTKGRDLVLEESSRLIEQIGNNVITKIGERSRQIEALCRSEASIGETLPKDARLFKTVVPNMVNFRGDQNVAGGGIWPEPSAFVPGVQRHSFFWGRDDKGELQFFNDYNTIERGYHNDEWYPVVRYSKPGNCFWSKSYMDPVSYQPMVTCTVAMRDKTDRFTGVATIDLKLEGLQAFLETMRKSTGGYLFLLDRNNKFLTFPKVEDVQIIGKDDKGKETKEFMTVSQFAEKQPLFKPIADAVNAMNKDILDRAKTMPGYKPELIASIDNDSDQIDKEEAEFITAVIADPLDEQTKQSNLYRKFEIKKDYIANESAIVFLFHVPQSYWKIVAVKPVSEAGAVAAKISWVLMTLISVTVLIGVFLAAFFMHKFFTVPLKTTTEAVLNLGTVVAEHRFDELDHHKIQEIRGDELGQLSQIVNSLAAELQSSYGSLVELNQNLERKVQDRTAELQKTLEEVSGLKRQQDGDYFLTSLLIKPLGVNRVQSDFTNVEFLVKQKKSFDFKNRRDELGGDICMADTLVLRNRKYTLFINGDAMGKSIQGAGGALVLGAVSRMIIERTKLSSASQNVYPERWLKNAFIEFQKMFESFDGSMLVSVVIGLIDDESGVLYYLNAEHPPTVIYRKNQAGFLDRDMMYRKLGIGGVEGKLFIRTYQLLPGDVLIVGSDGRDDILLSVDDRGQRTLNDDDGMFLKHVEAGRGLLTQIYDSILEMGEITDDLSLIRIGYGESMAGANGQGEQLALTKARDLAKSGNLEGSVKLLEEALNEHPQSSEIARRLVKYYLDKKDFEKAGSLAERVADAGHIDPEFAYIASYCMKKTGALKRAADLGERVYLRDPDMIRNITNLAEVHAKLGNAPRALELCTRALSLEPQNAIALKVQELITSRANSQG